MNNINPVIEIKNVCASYGTEKVLHEVSLTIMEGELVVLIGPSGCGKTTLLKLINGLVLPEAGEVTVSGKNVNSCNIINLRKRIGYAVQGAKLFPHMTVENNICYVPSLERKLSKQDKRGLSEEMLSLVQLPSEVKSRFPGQLSGGQQQRVGIARALASHPDILLMDEPFGAVDEITRKGLQEELLSLQKKTNITIVFITHDVREAVKLGSRIIVMKDGGILQEGTPDVLLKHPAHEFVECLFEDLIGTYKI